MKTRWTAKRALLLRGAPLTFFALVSSHACSDGVVPGAPGAAGSQNNGPRGGSASSIGNGGAGPVDGGSPQTGSGGMEPGSAPDPECGNAREEAEEACDDGNLENGDGCTDACQLEGSPDSICGNDVREPGEDCDPPDNVTCSDSCQQISPEDCGNSEIEGAEECDDGNLIGGDGCDDLCQDEVGAGGGAGGQAGGQGGGSGQGGLGQGGIGQGGGSSGGAGEGGSGSETRVVIAESGFDDDADGWTNAGVTAVGVVFNSSADADNSSVSGSVDVRFLSQGFSRPELRVVSGAVHCVPVEAERTYGLSASYFIDSITPGSTRASFTVFFHPAADCSDSHTSSWSSPHGTERGDWKEIDHDFFAPAGTRALRIRFNVSKIAGDAPTQVTYDNFLLLGPGTIGVCGDGDLNLGETCDDSNTTAGDGCDALCQVESVCGNSSVEPGEQCEPPSTSTCNAECQVIGICGDSSVQAGEQCDPPDSVTCDELCQLKDTPCDTCGDEHCTEFVDPCLSAVGNATSGPAMGEARAQLCYDAAECIRNLCDAEPTIGSIYEKCYCGGNPDDCHFGITAPTGPCKTEIEAAAETDAPDSVGRRLADSALGSTIGEAAEIAVCRMTECSLECTVVPVCGNGTREFGEECDDANTTPGDDCDEFCKVEPECGNDRLEPEVGEQCDDGNTTAGDGCDAACLIETVCGDGQIEGSEECDPPAAKCTAECRILPECGNSRVEASLSEECDDGNLTAGDGCGATCKIESNDACASCTVQACPEENIACTNDGCRAVLNCYRTTECGVAATADCFCGTADALFCGAPGFADGQCKAVIEEAADSTDPIFLIDNLLDTANPAGRAGLLQECRRSNGCDEECGLDP